MPTPRAALFRPLLLSAALGMLPALAAPCDNVVKPFRVGWVWSYRTVPAAAPTSGPADAQAASAYQVRSRVAEGGYEDVYTAGDKTQGTFRFRCVQGALTVVSLPSMEGVEISRSSVTGVSLPAAADWKPGLSWTQVWTLEGRKGLLSGSAVVSSRSQVLSRESVPEEVINDIIHLGSSKWENPAITDYKAAHPGLMAWLRGNLNYSATLKLMEEEGLTPFK